MSFSSSVALLTHTFYSETKPIVTMIELLDSTIDVCRPDVTFHCCTRTAGGLPAQSSSFKKIPYTLIIIFLQVLVLVVYIKKSLMQ